MFFVLGLLEKEGTCVAEVFTIVPKRLMIQLYEKRTLLFNSPLKTKVVENNL